MNLEEKQTYYEYVGGWSYKTPPTLDRELHRRLREIDPALHLVWCGAAVFRSQPDGDPVKVWGDPLATKKLLGRLTARRISARVKQFCGYSYKLKNGREKTVMRQDAIPKTQRELAIARFEYVDYGQLRWCLFRHLSAEQLVAAGIYDKFGLNIPPDGELIHRLTVETPEGRYWEPDQAWVEMIAASTFETFNTPLTDLYRRDREAREQRDELQARATAQLSCISPEALLKFTIDQPRSL